MNDDLFYHLVSIRRNIHEHPELGYREFRTASIICSELDRLQIHYKKEVAKTGVVALLKKGEGPCVVLRADMDALPIGEETGLDFASKTIDCMHACGHDIHTTMLIGAAHLLKDQEFSGCVKFIFQPSEEGNYDDPDKKSGGERIAESELNDVKAAVGLHVHPLLPVGKIGFALGQSLACANFFQLTVLGKAGHAGAAHHLAIDAVMISGALMQSLQTIISRYTNATQPAVLSSHKFKVVVRQILVQTK